MYVTGRSRGSEFILPGLTPWPTQPTDSVTFSELQRRLLGAVGLVTVTQHAAA